MQITVTHADIRKGILNSPTADPIALAAQRIGLKRVVVGQHTLSFDGIEPGSRRVVLLPDNAVRFIKKAEYCDRFELLKEHGKSRISEPLQIMLGFGELFKSEELP